jgi:hypothetical protein
VVLTRAQRQQMEEQQAALNQQILLALQAITQQLQAQN